MPWERPGEARSFGASGALPEGLVWLAVRVDGARHRFYCPAPGQVPRAIGEALDVSVVSDEGGRGEHASFTGAFVGMLAHGLTGQGWSADFRSLDYSPG